jgi:hypothetical protein
MARRNKKTEEENVTTTAPEATEPQTEDTAAAVADEAAEETVDLSAFEAAVESAVSERDPDTGELATAQAEPAVVEYRKLSGQKAKAAARSAVSDKMRDAMSDTNFTLARAYMVISDSLSSAPTGGGRAGRTPTNPTDAYVEQDAAIRLAPLFLEQPEGLDEDWADKVNAILAEAEPQVEQYKAWVAEGAEGDAPEVHPVVVRAAKMASGRAAGRRSSGSRAPFTGTRRDIAKHITEAFEGKGSGEFLSVAQIRAFKSSEYGDDAPSAGAISARLFPTREGAVCTIEGIEPGTNESTRGAFKQ